MVETGPHTHFDVGNFPHSTIPLRSYSHPLAKSGGELNDGNLCYFSIIAFNKHHHDQGDVWKKWRLRVSQCESMTAIVGSMKVGNWGKTSLSASTRQKEKIELEMVLFFCFSNNSINWRKLFKYRSLWGSLSFKSPHWTSNQPIKSAHQSKTVLQPCQMIWHKDIYTIVICKAEELWSWFSKIISLCYKYIYYIVLGNICSYPDVHVAYRMHVGHTFNDMGHVCFVAVPCSFLPC